MKNKEFNSIVEDQINSIRVILKSKAIQYANEDRLHNFKEAANDQHCTNEQALFGMLYKHWVSIKDIINASALSNLPKHIDMSHIDEKITDTINYLILLKACLYEHITN